MRRYSLIEHYVRGEGTRYDLGGSGVPSLGLEDLGIDVSGITTDYGHVLGRPDLREAFATRLGVDIDQVIITIGAHEANNIAFLSCLSGGKVLVEKPYFEPLRNVPEAFGGRVTALPRSQMAGALGDDEYEMVVLANPNNPTGDTSDISEIHEKAVRSGAVVLIDEIYRPFTGKQSSINAAGERTIVSCSLSKVGGMGGTRTGWLVSTPDLAPMLRRAKENLNPTNNTFGELAAMAFLDRHDEFIARARRYAAEGRGLLRDALPGFEIPENGMPFAYVRYREGPASIDVAEHLLDEKGLLLFAGEHFGDRKAFRIATGCHDREAYGVVADTFGELGVEP